MSQNQQALSPDGFFHSTLLSRQGSIARMALEGGPRAKSLEGLHSLLCETLLSSSRSARNLRYNSFPRMSQMLADKEGLFQAALGRGLPADSFRAELLGWLDFLRQQSIIEILPVLDHENGSPFCQDYVIFQEDKASELALQSFVQDALHDSTAAAAYWLAHHYNTSIKNIEEALLQKNPAFIRALPYYRLADGLRSDWHPPTAEPSAVFGLQMKGKLEWLGLVYRNLIAEGHLRFQTRFDGIRALGERYPLAWPATAPAELLLIHERLRTLFVRDLLLSEKAQGKPDPKSPLYHRNIQSGPFQKIYQSYIEGGDVIPSVATAHSMGVQFFQFHQKLFTGREDLLKANPILLFARNAVAFMIMHSDAVNDIQRKNEQQRFQEVVESCIQKLMNANALVDLQALVKTEVLKTEAQRKELIEAIRQNERVKTIEIEDRSAFGAASLQVFAFHISRLEDICSQAYFRARREKGFSLHLHLERVFNCVEDPARLQPYVMEETYARFLQTRQDYYIYRMPLLKRMLWLLLRFRGKADRSQVKGFMKATIQSEDTRVAGLREKVERSELKKEKERIAREAVKRDGAKKVDSVSASSEALGTTAGAGFDDSRLDLTPDPKRPLAPAPVDRRNGSGQKANLSQPSQQHSPQPIAVEAWPDESGAEHADDDAIQELMGLPDEALQYRPLAQEAEISQVALGRNEEPYLTESGTRAEAAGPGAAKRNADKASVRSASGPEKTDWEENLVRLGSKVGIDLTEQRRVQRQIEKEKEREERKALADKKRRERKPINGAGRPKTSGAADERTPGGPKHLVIIDVPVELSMAGKPGRVQFQKKFFKSESFRSEMAAFYRKEAEGAQTKEEIKYFSFLIRTLETDYRQYLK